MNKKIFLIPVAIGILVFIILSITRTDAKIGNKFKAEVPAQVANSSSLKIKGLNLYADFSGSMRGFVDFRNMQDTCKVSNQFISTTTNFLDKVESEYGIQSSSYIGGRKYTKGQFRTILRNGQGFNANTTLLHQVFAKSLATASDTSLSVIVSDMVLSFGRKELLSRHDSDYNLHQLNALGSEIHSVMTSLKQKGLDVLILQYLSSFNGRYYCNYTENLQGAAAYQFKHMKNRPFYIAIMGKKETLQAILEKNLITSAHNVYASFDFDGKLVEDTFDLTENDKIKIWEIGDNIKGDKQLLGTIWSQNEWGDTPSSMHVSCSAFRTPPFLGKSEISIADYPKEIVSGVNHISYDEKNGLSFDFNLVNYSNLPEEETEVDFKCYKSNDWTNEATTKNDVAQELQLLEGKTWGFSTITDYTDKAFFSKGRDSKNLIGKISFKIIKK